jgi:hypothetical protein
MNAKNELDSEILTTDVTSINDVTPKNILSFAKAILLALAILFIIGIGVECYQPGSAVFEACKLTLPSLATLVIGYYFGTTK